MSDDTSAVLIRALDAAHAAGREVRFWLRDDDAVAPTPALDRLLTLSAAEGVPVTLAVIPRDTGAALAERLAAAPRVRVAVHGWAHENHALPPRKKQELGPDRPAETVLTEIARGHEKLSALHGGRLLPLLVPPWNRIAPGVVAGLPALGFAALSTFGPEDPAAPMRAINTHVDPIDWHGSRSLCPEASLWQGAAQRVADLGTGPVEGTVGLLTHHLVHDAAIWDFVERFIALTRAHPACRWIDPAEVIASSSR
ncbi:polysaccharide deacetylase family protein [Paenirhodobacter enshiensis]|uniref:polysaccharide deacetylase family protein n=1 Tax=Paenirhodobacter enshiensis TaxID=1105367 RepID=UPI0035ADC732